MALKRKRSTDELSPPSSTSSSSSTASLQQLRAAAVAAPTSPSPPAFPNSVASHPSLGTWGRRRGGGDYQYHDNDLNSRTRKRWRDNRPDEATIHKNTLHKLFAAAQQQQQQQQHHHHDAQIVDAAAETILPRQQQPQQQTSLHSFWKFGHDKDFVTPGGMDGSWSTATQHRYQLAAALNQEGSWRRGRRRGISSVGPCEDCDERLDDDDDDDVQEVDDSVNSVTDEAALAERWNCSACGKCVCDRCAVLRDMRVCLDCVMLD